MIALHPRRIHSLCGFQEIKITLKEWENVRPEPGSDLYDVFLPDDPKVRRVVDELAERKMLRITEERHGTVVAATSFVGRVRIGNITVTVQPKITGMPLTCLLCYAFGLRDIVRAGSGTTDFMLRRDQPFHDLLIHQLASEVRALIGLGLRREYRQTEQWLGNPRGRIEVERIAREGINGRFFQEGKIPCILHDRSGDTALNFVLRAGLRLGMRLTEDATLKASLNNLDSRLEAAGVPSDHQRRSGLRELLRQVRREQSRLTAAYSPALTLIELLATAGPSLDGGEEVTEVSLPGFLFDMNRLFQAVLFRFLSENLPEPYTVYSERRIRHLFVYDPEWNPRSRRSPTPRPDFAVMQGKETILFLDAKYRDLWERSLPREMLYQLAIYALSQGNNAQNSRQAVILYPTMSVRATEARIQVHDPVGSRGNPAMVILRPVNLISMAELIHDRNTSGRTVRAELATSFVFGNNDCLTTAVRDS